MIPRDPGAAETASQRDSKWNHHRDRLFQGMALILIVGLPLFLAWWLPLGDLFLTGGDEGIELAKAAHFARTGEWSAKVWNDQPLTHTRLYAWMTGRWPGPIGPRWWSLGCFALLLGSVYGFVYQQRPDRCVAFAAVSLFAVSPLVLDLSIAAMQEMPSTAFGMASVCLVSRHDFSAKRRIQVLAVLAAVVGIVIKLTAGIYAFAAVLMLVRRLWAEENCPTPSGNGSSWFRWVSRSWSPASPANLGRTQRLLPLGYAVGVALGATLGVWWLDGRPLGVLLGSHWAALQAVRSSVGPEGDGPWKHLIRLHPFLVWFLLWGGFVALRARKRVVMVGGDAVVLLFVVGAFNAFIRPWWEYYALSCWLAMTPLAAIGWVEALRAWHRRGADAEGLNWRGAMAWCGSCAAVVAGCYWTWSWAREVSNFRASPRASSARILDIVRRQADLVSGGTIYSVDPIVAFWAGLRVPESLLVVTQKRYLSGDLEPTAIPMEVRRAGCDLVVIPQGLDLEKVPDWPVVLREDYVLVALVEGREIYVHQRWKPHPLETRMRW